jgi:hypothetical protein
LDPATMPPTSEWCAMVVDQATILSPSKTGVAT